MLDFAHYASLLCSAVLSDVLEGMGHSHQAMRPFIRPADESRVLRPPWAVRDHLQHK